MPIFFQHSISDFTRLGIWKIEESEEFFKEKVPQHRDVTHPHKRLQHLAGRFLLPFLFPEFPQHLVRIADTRKPFLPGDPFHFSISHCGDYAAAIVSHRHRVGIDIEIPVQRILRIKDKFLNETEKGNWADESTMPDHQLLTLLWSCKESVFKWFGNGGVDFSSHILLSDPGNGTESFKCLFTKIPQALTVNYRKFDQVILTWVES